MRQSTTIWESGVPSPDMMFRTRAPSATYDPLILRGARSRSSVRYLGQISAVRFMRHSGETSTVRSTKTKEIQALSSYRESIKRADKTQACKQSQVRNKPRISSYISFNYLPIFIVFDYIFMISFFSKDVLYAG